MNCIKVLSIGLIWLIVSLNPLSAQDTPKAKKQDFPISVSYNNHSWAFPLGSIFRANPQYPGLTIGTELNYRVRTKTTLFQSFEVGGFLNSASGNGSYANTNFGFRYTGKRVIMFDVGLGLGLFKSYHINDTYQQQENGSYLKVKDKGINALSNNIFLSLGYDLSVKHNRNLMVFARYQWIASGAYWSLTTIRPNGLFHVGVRRSLRTNK